MTRTIADFRARFSEFTATAQPDERVTRAQELAAVYVPTSGPDLLYHYATAHILLATVVRQLDSKSKPINASAGRVSGMTVGPRMVHHQLPEGDDLGNHWNDPYWDATSYGQQARLMAKQRTSSMAGLAFVP